MLLEKIEIDTTAEMVQNVYSKLEKNILTFKKTLNRDLTLSEKIFAICRSFSLSISILSLKDFITNGVNFLQIKLL